MNNNNRIRIRDIKSPQHNRVRMKKVAPNKYPEEQYQIHRIRICMKMASVLDSSITYSHEYSINIIQQQPNKDLYLGYSLIVAVNPATNSSRHYQVLNTGNRLEHDHSSTTCKFRYFLYRHHLCYGNRRFNARRREGAYFRIHCQCYFYTRRWI